MTVFVRYASKKRSDKDGRTVWETAIDFESEVYEVDQNRFLVADPGGRLFWANIGQVSLTAAPKKSRWVHKEHEGEVEYEGVCEESSRPV